MHALLDNLGLSAAAREARKGWIGGSDANVIMGVDPAKLIRLWREKRGEAEPEDLSDILAVQMGSFTEPFNAAWFEKQTGFKVTCRGMALAHKSIPHMRATLDGLVAQTWPGNDGETDGTELGVFEAKHCGTRSADAELFARYVPQLTHNCLVAGEQAAFLSIFKGNGDWVMFEYDLDPAYAEALVAAEAAFWQHVQDGTPPAPLPSDVATPKPVGVLEVSMDGNNEWSTYAADYLETVLAADRHEIARRSLKALVPNNASRCFGYGVELRRDKRGALRFHSSGAD